MTNEQDVQMEITSRHGHVSEDTRTYAERKITKLIRFNNRISRMQMVLDKHKEERVLEMIVHVDSGATFVAKERARGYRVGIDLIVEKMERQLLKEKEKRTRHKGDGGLRGNPRLNPSDPVDDDLDKDVG